MNADRATDPDNDRATDLADLWPAAGLSVSAGDLELRWIDDAVLPRLAHLAAAGIHDPGSMPFGMPWTRGTPEQITRRVMEYQWSARSQLGPEGLRLEMAVMVDDRVAGVQAASADHWSTLRTAETGSWLGREFQGRGIGKRMRILMLHLLFAGLGAQCVTSGAFADNPASNAVSLATGYAPNGTARVVREGQPAVENHFVMDRDRWLGLREDHARTLGAPITMTAAQAVRTFIDVSAAVHRHRQGSADLAHLQTGKPAESLCQCRDGNSLHGIEVDG